jgi:polar amino acid transport system substrate-binding protein
MRRPLRHLVGPALLVLALAGCGVSSDHALNLTLSALSTPIATAPKPPPTGTASCDNLKASLRPPARLPAPNHMPAGSFMAKIQKQGYLVAGVNEGAYKFGALNPATGNIEGFEVDLVKQVAKAIFGDANPRHVRLVALSVLQRFSAVQKGTVDIVADTITITCYRRTLVDFSTVYYDASQRLLVPSNSRVENIGQLAHQRVCASKGSTPIDVMNRMPKQSRPIPDGKAQAIDCLVALQQGQENIAGISTDSGLLLGFHAQDPNMKIVGPSLGDVPYGMAINRGHQDFVRFVNGVLAKLKSDGTWQRLYAHWLGDFSQGATPAPPPAQYDG